MNVLTQLLRRPTIDELARRMGPSSIAVEVDDDTLSETESGHICLEVTPTNVEDDLIAREEAIVKDVKSVLDYLSPGPISRYIFLPGDEWDAQRSGTFYSLIGPIVQVRRAGSGRFAIVGIAPIVERYKMSEFLDLLRKRYEAGRAVVASA